MGGMMVTTAVLEILLRVTIGTMVMLMWDTDGDGNHCDGCDDDANSKTMMAIVMTVRMVMKMSL